MEIEKLISAFEETILNLRKSESSGWSNMPIEEIIRKLEAEVSRTKGVIKVPVYLRGHR